MAKHVINPNLGQEMCNKRSVQSQLVKSKLFKAKISITRTKIETLNALRLHYHKKIYDNSYSLLVMKSKNFFIYFSKYSIKVLKFSLF